MSFIHNTIERYKLFYIFLLLVFLFTPKIGLSQDTIFPNDGMELFRLPNTRLDTIESRIKQRRFEDALALIEAYRKKPLETYKDSLGYIISFSYESTISSNAGDTQKRMANLRVMKKLIKDWNISHNVIEALILHQTALFYYSLDMDVLDDCIAAVDSALLVYTRGPYQNYALFQSITETKYQAYSYSSREGSTDTVFKYLDIQKEIYDHHSHLIPLINEHDRIGLLSLYANAYSNEGDFNKSISYNLEVVRRFKKLSVFDPNEYLGAVFWLSIAHYYNNQFQESIFYAKEAIDLYLEQAAPNDFSMLQYYNMVGINYEALGQIDSALVWLDKCEQILTTQDDIHPATIGVFLNMGSNHTKKGNLKKGERYLLQAIQLNKAIYGKKHSTNAQAYQSLYMHYTARGKYNVALAYIDSALQSVVPSHVGGVLSSPKLETKLISNETMEILREHMLAQMAVYKQDESQYEYLKAIVTSAGIIQKRLDDKRKGYNQLETALLQSTLFKSSYEATIEALYRLYKKTGDTAYLDQVTGYMNASKSRALVSEMGEFRLIDNENIPDTLKTEFFKARKQVAILNSSLNTLLANDIDSDSIGILNSQKINWDNRLAIVKKALIDQFQSSNPLLSPTVDLPEILKFYNVDEPNKAIIEYFVGSTNITVLGITKSQSVLLQIPRDSLFDESLDTFLNQISDREAQLSKFKNNSFYLYQKLLFPMLDALGEEITKLTIIADEKLNQLPFELLTSSQPSSEQSFKELDYLLHDYLISYRLSASTFNQKTQQTSGNGILGIAYVGEGVADERAELGGLPGAMDEIGYLEENFKGTFYRGKSGNKQRFLKEVGQYDVLHLALHGKADLENRFNSTLIFNGEDDYNLSAHDLYGVELNTQLVVLSACESGIGKLSTSEGSFSVARGFASVGVPSIITTLWKVNDQAGARIVKSFYGNLKEGDDKDEALRKAKLSFLETSDDIFSHPYYWGSYIVIGDVSPVHLESAGNLQLYLTIALLSALAIIAFAIVRKRRSNI